MSLAKKEWRWWLNCSGNDGGKQWQDDGGEDVKEDVEEESVDEREHSIQREYLKIELDQVLKGIREMGDEGVLEKHAEGLSNSEDITIDIKEVAEDMHC